MFFFVPMACSCRASIMMGENFEKYFHSRTHAQTVIFFILIISVLFSFCCALSKDGIPCLVSSQFITMAHVNEQKGK